MLIGVLFFLFCLPTGTFQSRQSQRTDLVGKCEFEGQLHESWSQCQCVSVPVVSTDARDYAAGPTIHVMCTYTSTATVPPLPSSENLPNSTPPVIVALSMTDGSLAFIQQDAFKHQDIQALDFSNNQIQTVNVNAFRGLEMKLTQLDLSQNNLSVIPTWALTYLHSLQSLHLENNRIEVVRSNTFDETQLTNLHFLYLDNNQLQVIPNLAFYRLPLVVLMMANNRIVEIQKMSLPSSLTFLVLRNNLLTQVPYLALNNLNSLQNLDLEGNNITTMTSNPEVVFDHEMKLMLRHNQIRQLDRQSFISFRKILDLDVSYNQISRLDDSCFQTVGHMVKLDMSYNRIAHLPRGMLKNFAKTLNHLNLEENVIHTTPDALKDLRNLISLNLNGNKLNKLDDDMLAGSKGTIRELFLANNHLKSIPEKALSGMNRLENLDLSKNRIKELKPNAFGIEYGETSSLSRLNLGGNKLGNITHSGVFSHMGTLTYLDLSYNRIRNLAPRVFEHLKGLESLFLQNNQLDRFPTASVYRLEKLRHLMLDNNRISKIDNYSLADLPKLQHLSLAGNKIQTISENMFSSSSTRELKSLNLAYNQIGSISSRAFYELENLQQLRLSHNHLRIIPALAFSNLRSLRYLDLSHNRIIKVLPSSFSHLPALDILHLEHNNMHEIDRDAFRFVNNVQTLRLSNNAFRQFNCEQLGSITHVTNLDLEKNQINEIDIPCIATNIKRLNLASNSLEKISRRLFQDAVQLVELDVSQNGIIEVDKDAFTECRALAHINLAQNYVRNLWKGTFVYQNQLNVVDLSDNDILFLHHGIFGKNTLLMLKVAGNKLTRVPVEALSTTGASLTHLDLSRNQIKIVESGQLSDFKNLSFLSFAQNKVDAVEEAAFEHLTSLKTLDLSHNPVTSWSPTAFRDLSHSMSVINIADTGLFSIPKLTHRSLHLMNISHNKIYEITEKDVLALTKLVSLDVSYNNIKGIDAGVFQKLVNLKSLNISANPITHIYDEHVEHFYQLETLHISDMSSLLRLPEAHTFNRLSNLKNLKLYNIPDAAKPYEVPRILYHLPPLHTLTIEVKDSILDHQLHSADTRLLRELTIVGRNLSAVEVGAFANIRGFRVHISLENTMISYWPPKIFDTLTGVSLLSLSLANNSLGALEPFLSTSPPVVNQHGTILQYIRLENNPIECNCSMRWVDEYVKVSSLSHSGSSHDFDKVQCAFNMLLSSDNLFSPKVKYLGQRHEELSDHCETRVNSSFRILSVLFLLPFYFL